MMTLGTIGIIIAVVAATVVGILAFLMPVYVYQLNKKLKSTNKLLFDLLKTNARIITEIPNLDYLCDLTAQTNEKLDSITAE